MVVGSARAVCAVDKSDGPTRGGVGVGSIDELHHLLGAAAASGAGENGLSRVDRDDAVYAAVGFCADPGGAVDGRVVAGQVGRAAAGAGRLQLPGAARRAVDWSGFGVVIPVLAGSAGAGASVLAAVLTDALAQVVGLRVLLVDAADPARSGLAGAAAVDGPWVRRVGEHVAVRFSWRAEALVARLEAGGPITAGMVPAPPRWRPAVDRVHVTVVDVGHDGWRAAADPLVGAGGWLRTGPGSVGPVVVVRPTRPSLRHAEQVLARLHPWVAAGAAAPAAQLVVTGATRWPGGVVGVAGRQLEPLLPSAVFLPHDPALEVGGVTADPMHGRVVAAVGPLLSRWGFPATTRRGWPGLRRKGNR